MVTERVPHALHGVAGRVGPELDGERVVGQRDVSPEARRIESPHGPRLRERGDRRGVVARALGRVQRAVRPRELVPELAHLGRVQHPRVLRLALQVCKQGAVRVRVRAERLRATGETDGGDKRPAALEEPRRDERDGLREAGHVLHEGIGERTGSDRVDVREAREVVDRCIGKAVRRHVRDQPREVPCIEIRAAVEAVRPQHLRRRSDEVQVA